TPATDEMLTEAVHTIVGKKKPMLICGGGVRYSEASREFLEFAEAFNMPIGETQAGKGAVPAGHKLNLGGIGTTGNLSSNTVARDADIVIGVGTRFSDFTTASKTLFQNPDVEFISINISDFDTYKMDAVKVVADAKSALVQLGHVLRQRRYVSGYTTEISQAKDAWAAEMDRLCSLTYTGDDFVPEVKAHTDTILPDFFEAFKSRLTQTQVLGALNRMIGDEAIAVGSSGSLPGDMQRMWEANEPNTYNMEYGFSCMGYEINGALGAKLAEPDKEVYSFVGDGSYMMAHSELITSIQENQKINILLFDNTSFGCINNLQMGSGMGSFGTEFRHRNPATGQLDGALLKIDFAMNAAAYGVKTYTVTTMKELQDAVADAKKQTVSTLLDIKVLPKTMTDGYESWWRFGVAEVSKKKEIQAAYAAQQEGIKKARQY
ncbi:MAG: 3D-(3,5/4)-trihydroxycyclohexane-1,2-dione acylhydrolase (decyclizing), partial [Planctomycetes bacterium]|nr:3D-(3,5/4)-trihydroxycyclohexane-1,2-dione acylhydrolase (decyclizing) [Planctomycetota bacterium]